MTARQLELALLADLSLETQLDLVWPVLLAALGAGLLLGGRRRAAQGEDPAP